MDNDISMIYTVRPTFMKLTRGLATGRSRFLPILIKMQQLFFGVGQFCTQCNCQSALVQILRNFFYFHSLMLQSQIYKYARHKDFLKCFEVLCYPPPHASKVKIKLANFIKNNPHLSFPSPALYPMVSFSHPKAEFSISCITTVYSVILNLWWPKTA